MTALTLLDEVATYLSNQGLGTIGKNLFKFQLPPSPVKSAAIKVTGGPRVRGEVVHRPEVQILVRDEHDGYKSGLSRTQDFFKALDHKAGFLSTIQARCIGNHEPGPFFRDTNNRYVFTLNFRLITTS